MMFCPNFLARGCRYCFSNLGRWRCSSKSFAIVERFAIVGRLSCLNFATAGRLRCLNFATAGRWRCLIADYIVVQMVGFYHIDQLGIELRPSVRLAF
jgi:hypothetical protein